MRNKGVVITGLGIVSPLGIGIRQYWDNLLKKKFPLRKIDLFPTEEFKCKYAFQIQNFNFNRYFKDLKSDYIPRSTKFILTAVKKALKDAYLENSNFYSDKAIGVFTSTVYGSMESAYRFILKILLEGPDNVDPMAFPSALINYSSNYVSIVNGFKGPNVTFSSGSPAGLEAINFASSLIRQGFIKTAVVSGLNDLSIYSYAPLSLKGFLFESGDKRCYKTGIFNNIRNGLIFGENASTIILEDMDCAKKRKARIYAQISGYSANFGKNDSAYVKTINGAVNNSGLSSKDIGFCMLNSNGVKFIDTMEINATKNIFKDNLGKIDFVLIKENNGECEGASSILQVLTAAKIIYSKTIPNSVLYRYTKSGVFDKINIKFSKPREKITNSLINAFNLEGNNAALIIKGLS